MIYTIYKITNIINQKIYIGFSKNSNIRFKEHCKNAFRNKYKNKNSVFYCSLRKHGVKNFIIEEICSSKDKEYIKNILEPHFIKEYNSHYIYGHGYNMTYGGEGGDTSNSPNYRIGISKRNQRGNNNPQFGKPAWNRGKKMSIESRQKLSNSCKGRIPWNKKK